MTQSRIILICACLLVAGVGIGAYLYFSHDGSFSGIFSDDNDSQGSDSAARSPETWRDRLTRASAKSVFELDRQAPVEWAKLQNADERKELLRWYSTQPNIIPRTGVLRKAMAADPDPAVQEEAFKLSLELGKKIGHKPEAEVIEAALALTNANIQKAALYAARDCPDPSLVPPLLMMADSSVPHNFLALDALAFIDDQRARDKVYETATNEGAREDIRTRAVALLAKTKDTRARSMLEGLAAGSDDGMRAIAEEVLRIMDEGK